MEDAGPKNRVGERCLSSVSFRSSSGGRIMRGRCNKAPCLQKQNPAFSRNNFGELPRAVLSLQSKRQNGIAAFFCHRPSGPARRCWICSADQPRAARRWCCVFAVQARQITAANLIQP